MRIAAILFWACIFSATSLECMGQTSKPGPRRAKADRIVREVKPKLYNSPKITLVEALKLAGDYIQKSKIDISEYSLVEAKLIYMPSEGVEEPRYWRFWWAKSGGEMSEHIEIGVFMDGRTGQWVK